jgi:hypothetical protein
MLFVLQNAPFFVAIVEPCSEETRWLLSLFITGKRSREQAGDIDRSPWVAAPKWPRTAPTLFESETAPGSISGS